MFVARRKNCSLQCACISTLGSMIERRLKTPSENWSPQFSRTSHAALILAVDVPLDSADDHKDVVPILTNYAIRTEGDWQRGHQSATKQTQGLCSASASAQHYSMSESCLLSAQRGVATLDAGGLQTARTQTVCLWKEACTDGRTRASLLRPTPDPPS